MYVLYSIATGDIVKTIRDAALCRGKRIIYSYISNISTTWEGSEIIFSLSQILILPLLDEVLSDKNQNRKHISISFYVIQSQPQHLHKLVYSQKCLLWSTSDASKIWFMLFSINELPTVSGQEQKVTRRKHIVKPTCFGAYSISCLCYKNMMCRISMKADSDLWLRPLATIQQTNFQATVSEYCSLHWWLLTSKGK